MKLKDKNSSILKEFQFFQDTTLIDIPSQHRNPLIFK